MVAGFKIYRLPFAACLLFLAIGFAARVFAQSDESQPQSIIIPQPPSELPFFLKRIKPNEGLENLLRIGERIYSGGEPTRAGFEALKQMGVNTIVSVDGLPPDLETANRLGFKYIHIPLGYDGIDPQELKQIATLMATIKGAMYIHCHHGKHRGPAAVAACMIITGELDRKQAMEYMAVAGTSRDYKGLWQSVAAIKPGEYPAGMLTDLCSSVQGEGIAEKMARLDRRWVKIQEQFQDSLETQYSQADCVAIAEYLRESARAVQRDREGTWGDSKKTQALAEGLLRSSEIAEQLVQAIKSGEKNTASEKLNSLAAECKKCHEAHRD